MTEKSTKITILLFGKHWPLTYRLVVWAKTIAVFMLRVRLSTTKMGSCCWVSSSDWRISTPAVSLSDLLPRRSAVARFSCCCAFWSWVSILLDFYSTIPVDVVRVKYYMNCLFDPARVVMWVTINNFTSFQSVLLVSGVVGMLWNIWFIRLLSQHLVAFNRKVRVHGDQFSSLRIHCQQWDDPRQQDHGIFRRRVTAYQRSYRR